MIQYFHSSLIEIPVLYSVADTLIIKNAVLILYYSDETKFIARIKWCYNLIMFQHLYFHEIFMDFTFLYKRL